MLRRSKEDTINGVQILNLPPKTITVVTCDFSKEERRFYQSLAAKMADAVSRIKKTNDNRAYMHMLTLLLRLRQGKDLRFTSLRLSVNHDTQHVITLRWSMETGKQMKMR